VVWLAGAALVALVPSTGAAAYSSPAPSHPAIVRSLSWRVVPSPDRLSDDELFGVTCPSARSCTAVGRGGGKTLVERWNGTAWSIAHSRNRSGFDELLGVSCVSGSACTAVGASAQSESSPRYRTLAETWNGTAWSILPTPNPDTGQDPDILSSVSCVTAAFCAAVGEYGPADSAEPVTEIWNGRTWSVAPSPQKLDDASLESVSCVSATACTAVGFQYSASLAESWNGHRWSVVSSANPGPDSNLAGVVCTPARTCTAVGTYVNDALPTAPNQTLVESGDSSGLSVVPSPNAGGAGAENSLAGVSCASRRACIAVGNASGGNITTSAALIEAWNGTRWSVVPGHVSGNFATLLYGVSCPSAAMCMATGVRYTSSSLDSGQTLTELGTSSG
jgi:hypothetical protein